MTKCAVLGAILGGMVNFEGSSYKSGLIGFVAGSLIGTIIDKIKECS